MAEKSSRDAGLARSAAGHKAAPPGEVAPASCGCEATWREMRSDVHKETLAQPLLQAPAVGIRSMWTICLSCLFFSPRQAFSFKPRQIFFVLVCLDDQLPGSFPRKPVPLSHPGRVSSSYSTRRRFSKELDLASRKQKPSFALFNDIFNFSGRNPARQSTPEFLFTPMQDNVTANIVSNLCYLAENYILRASE